MTSWCMRLDFSRALTHLREVFTAIPRAGLSLSPKKCNLLRPETTFPGQVVSVAGVATDPAEVVTVKDLASYYITCHLADAFIQSDLQLIRLSRGQSPLEKCGVKGLSQGPNSCADLIVATAGIEPPTLRVKVK